MVPGVRTRSDRRDPQTKAHTPQKLRCLPATAGRSREKYRRSSRDSARSHKPWQRWERVLTNARWAQSSVAEVGILSFAEIVKEIEVPLAALDAPALGTGDSGHLPVAEQEEVGIPIPAPGLLQVTERRQPLSSVSSLEVHFDLLDLTELTDMSDQELAEVFADSDDENLTGESPAGLHPLPRAGCLRSPSWTRTRAEQNREKQHLGDPERQPAIVDTFLTVERPKEN
ncbi:Dysbindin domain-containing protein 1 [Myotis brandtii]|uniref:Dysbindin domain-containing protein 1 n=1 Tax=Myotis brandtii TaxID=109478 RepID=S7P385_MYOBR|nr:PREDICTED: dysbindin domain-containing protein 1 [Myotis brandtii]EPQ04618.1 Dysbindin domain-containing protein 1 [Myotis brandtii]